MFQQSGFVREQTYTPLVEQLTTPNQDCNVLALGAAAVIEEDRYNRHAGDANYLAHQGSRPTDSPKQNRAQYQTKTKLSRMLNYDISAMTSAAGFLDFLFGLHTPLL